MKTGSRGSCLFENHETCHKWRVRRCVAHIRGAYGQKESWKELPRSVDLQRCLTLVDAGSLGTAVSESVTGVN